MVSDATFAQVWCGGAPDAAVYTSSMSTDPTPEDGVNWLTTNRDALVNELRRTNGALAEEVRQKLDSMTAERDSLNIRDMFEMQMLMNKLSQMSEMTSGILAATNSAIASMARNVKA